MARVEHTFSHKPQKKSNNHSVFSDLDLEPHCCTKRRAKRLVWIGCGHTMWPASRFLCPRAAVASGSMRSRLIRTRPRVPAAVRSARRNSTVREAEPKTEKIDAGLVLMNVCDFNLHTLNQSLKTQSQAAALQPHPLHRLGQ